MSETSNAGKGCLGVFGFIALATLATIDFSGEPSAEAETVPAITTATSAVTEFPIDKEAREKREKLEKGVSKATSGPIKLSDLDDADRAIRRAINLSGNLCAKPIEVLPTGSPGLYGVQCITYRDGSGLSTYLVNSRTNEVSGI